MPVDPEEIAPEDDTGSETFARYYYQALVALPFCLECALGGDILRVVPEHHEDVALVCDDRWRFLQIKTKDEERGPWVLSDLLKEDGGALRSLYRTHQLMPDGNASLELVLEGPHSPRSPIKHLRRAGNRGDPDLVSRVATAFGIPELDARAFLERVVMHPPHATRDAIEAMNYRLLGDHAGHLTRAQIESIHAGLASRIEAAMRADPIGPNWPACVADPESAADDARQRLVAKTLERTELLGLIAPITAPARPLLRRVTEVGARQLTSVERKMTAAGADSRIQADARNLRMNALTGC